MTGRTITAIHGGSTTLTAAADASCPPRAWPTRTPARAYAGAIDRTIAVLGAVRLLAEVADDEVGAALLRLWGSAAEATWNRNRAGISSWLTWCQTRETLACPIGPGRLRTPPREPR